MPNLSQRALVAALLLLAPLGLAAAADDGDTRVYELPSENEQTRLGIVAMRLPDAGVECHAPAADLVRIERALVDDVLRVEVRVLDFDNALVTCADPAGTTHLEGNDFRWGVNIQSAVPLPGGAYAFATHGDFSAARSGDGAVRPCACGVAWTQTDDGFTVDFPVAGLDAEALMVFAYTSAVPRGILAVAVEDRFSEPIG